MVERVWSGAAASCWGLFTPAFLLWAGAVLAEDLGADFLNMEVGFLPKLKKAAPTKSLGLGLTPLKVMVIPFLGSVGLTDATTGAALSKQEQI